jgi:hypothetical protein
MGRPPLGKKAMSATERQRRWRASKRARSAPKPAAHDVLIELLHARLSGLEADHAALRIKVAEMERLILRLVDAGFAGKHKAALNQSYADARRLKRTLKGVTGYQPAADLILGPAEAENRKPKRGARRKRK